MSIDQRMGRNGRRPRGQGPFDSVRPGPGPDDADDGDDDDWDEAPFDPRQSEIWEPLELDDEESLPERGDFWPELDDPED